MVSVVAAGYAARKHSEHDGQVSVVAHKANLSGPQLPRAVGPHWVRTGTRLGPD